jgi:hexokinase
MSSAKENTEEFLFKHGMHPDLIDMQTHVADFLDEMEKGLAGEKSSLMMLPTYIEAAKEIPADEKVIVIDAGGTNFRTALVHFDANRKAVIEDFCKHAMPGAEKEVSRNEFFTIMAEQIKRFAGRSDKIGFCFSYPAEALPDKDGRALYFSKEIKAPQVVGEAIGAGVLKAAVQFGYDSGSRIALVNDTVTTLLMGATATKRCYDSALGFILGTGMNAAYEETNKNITKITGQPPDGRQIINIESGGFSRHIRGDFDREFDKSTINPGCYTFEKVMAGAYFGPLAVLTMRRAFEAGIFSSKARALLEPRLTGLHTADIFVFLNNPYNGTHNFSDVIGSLDADTADAFYLLFDLLAERVVKFAAVNLSAVLIKSDSGRRASLPACITIDGTTFYSLHNLSERISCAMRGILQGPYKRYYEFNRVDNASLLGAAVAALTNLR